MNIKTQIISHAIANIAREDRARPQKSAAPLLNSAIFIVQQRYYLMFRALFRKDYIVVV
jgi:hypothetical protein